MAKSRFLGPHDSWDGDFLSDLSDVLTRDPCFDDLILESSEF